MAFTSRVAVGIGTLGLAASAGLASPQESVTFNNVNSRGTYLSIGLSEERTATFTGSYVPRKIRVSGQLQSLVTGTFPREARVKVTAPTGKYGILQTNNNYTGFTVYNANDIALDIPDLGTANGEWTFRFFESSQDSAFGPDARWNTITFTLDDEPPLPPSPGEFKELTGPEGEAGELIATAMPVVGEPNQAGQRVTAINGRIFGVDADLYKIRICEPANFSAITSTIPGAPLQIDNYMYLFRPDGTCIVGNDSINTTNNFAGINNQRVASLPAGDYYLATATYYSPVASDGQRMFGFFSPGSQQTLPDGPGAAGTLGSWTGGGADGDYRILLTGVCFGDAPGACVADFTDANGSGTPDGGVAIEDLLFYLDLFAQGVTRADVDNGTSTGTPDGGVAIEDLLYYLVRFAEGC